MSFLVTWLSNALTYSTSNTISFTMCFSQGHKIQNPVLHLFGITGFSGNHGPFQILFPFRVERRNLVREYCWLLFIPNSSKSQWKLVPLTAGCVTIRKYDNRRVWQMRPPHFGFWIAECGFHVFETIISDGFDIYGQNPRIFLKILQIFWLNPDWLSFYG